MNLYSLPISFSPDLRCLKGFAVRTPPSDFVAIIAGINLKVPFVKVC